ncbi:hypothetical protein [Vreelandella sedimenti]|uniref:hypothetical protein n=1 Tax=Vreelandella sedimenti TaxID=2729618 RepID=UPI00257E4215|nr:hypothetical protein [Halomonas sp. UBA3173]|tara:strand:- start:37917 stop:38525 length:609 start_codon:yes stop_codon:yes gene_type:complete
MNTNDIKHLAVETIYLVPDSSEGQRCYLWCDDPAPGVGMDPSESVEYVRKDVHEAIIAKQAKAAIRGMDASKVVGSSNLEQAKRLHAESSPDALESERAANALLTERIAELEEREQALAAHVERFRSVALDSLCNMAVGRMREEMKSCYENSPATSLARRDALTQAEALEEAAEDTVPAMHKMANWLLARAADKRKQAEGLQ